MVTDGRGPDALRIAVVVNQFPLVSETFILNQITGLLDRGHSVDIIAGTIQADAVFHPDVAQYDLLSHTQAMTVPANRLERAVKAARLLVTRLPRHPGLLRTLDVLHYGRSALGLRTLFTAIPFLAPYDIVHCQYGTNGEAVGALMKRLRLQRKLVTTFHRFDLRLAEQQGGGVFRDLRRYGDCFLSISDHTRHLLLEFGFDPRKIVYHPVGIDVRRFQPLRRSAPPSEEIRIATVARLVPQKGLHAGIRAVSKLLGQIPGLRVRYDIAGGGPLREELLHLIGALGLDGIVHLNGPLAQDGVVDLLRRSDIFLLPSMDEVLPVSLMEAQAMGLPAVASAVAATHEIVQDEQSGFLVPPGDADALASKLRVLVEQPALRREYGDCGRRHVSAHFDVNALNDRLVEIYRHVLAGAPLERGTPEYAAEYH